MSGAYATSDPVQAFRGAILAALGHAPEDIEPGRLHRFRTSDRRADDAGWCKLFEDMRGGVFGCNRLGMSETWTADNPATMTRTQRADLARRVIAGTLERQRRQREQWVQNAERIAAMGAQSRSPVPGDPVALYLRRRGFGDVWPLPKALRLHPALPYWDGAEKLGTFAAMLAPVVATDGRTVAWHRTYLTSEGRKAAVPSPKKLTGAAGPLAGACIPLHKPARGCIGIAEGIETALAAWCASGCRPWRATAPATWRLGSGRPACSDC